MSRRIGKQRDRPNTPKPAQNRHSTEREKTQGNPVHDRRHDGRRSGWWTRIARATRIAREREDESPVCVAAARLLLLTKCRPGEVRRLRWCEVKPDRPHPVVALQIPAPMARKAICRHIPEVGAGWFSDRVRIYTGVRSNAHSYRNGRGARVFGSRGASAPYEARQSQCPIPVTRSAGAMEGCACRRQRTGAHIHPKTYRAIPSLGMAREHAPTRIVAFASETTRLAGVNCGERTMSATRRKHGSAACVPRV